MFFNARRKKLKKMFNADEKIVFYKDDFELFIDFNVAMKHIENIQNLNHDYCFLEYFIPILEAQLTTMMDDKKTKNRLLNLHQKLISNGTFDIWNNEIFYHQQNITVLGEVLAHILDDFTSKNKIVANTSIKDIYMYLNNKCNMNEIRVFDINEDTYKQKLRLNQIYDFIEFLDEISDAFLPEVLILNSSFKKYKFNVSFEKNIEYAVDNYNDIKESLKHNSLSVFKNHNKFPDEKIDVFIGDFIDYKSLYGDAFFLIIPELDDNFLVSISKINSEVGADVLTLFIFDSNLQKEADDEIYNSVSAFLKNEKKP